jgi:hypothetical protein
VLFACRRALRFQGVTAKQLALSDRDTPKPPASHGDSRGPDTVAAAARRGRCTGLRARPPLPAGALLPLPTPVGRYARSTPPRWLPGHEGDLPGLRAMQLEVGGQHRKIVAAQRRDLPAAQATRGAKPAPREHCHGDDIPPLPGRSRALYWPYWSGATRRARQTSYPAYGRSARRLQTGAALDLMSARRRDARGALKPKR